MKRTTRRGALAWGAAGMSGFAGCLGGAGGGEGDGGETQTGESESSATASDGGSFEDHPATASVESQPTLGSLDAGATVVAFEDPSCPRCRAFEQNTVPKIRSELVAPGDGAFVARTVPVVYPWGEPATHALEATFARDGDERRPSNGQTPSGDDAGAFWGLFGHYFARQSAFDGDNVLEKTESWLTENTDLDASAVVEDARSEAYGDAVRTDLDAADAAGVSGTPTVFLFRDGAYVTKASGSVSWDLIRSALGR